MDVIYTMAPIAKNEDASPALEMVSHHGCDCSAQNLGDNHYRIVQIYSSRFSDYFRNDLYPGKIIRL